MAVVTEPPWINQASGVAPRNGTTSHTISFGFTSASGNELVFIVFGAVTHMVASGWVERLQPVNSGELSVFTRTSAGDSSITVTHNGSNYPVCWAVYELPAGSSWTAGTGTSAATTDTFPSLAGLSGVEQVVWAARGRAAGGGSAGGSTWSAPWVEDADQFTPDASGTDGAYLTVGHQINVVAASVAPSAVTTYTGSWASPDREHVVFAFNVAAAGGGSSVAPAGVAVPVVLGAPTLAWSATVAPGGLSVPVAVGAPVVGAAGVNPDGVTVPVAVGDPTLAWSGSLALDGIGVPVVLGAPVVGVAPVAPDGVTVPVALGLPVLAWSGAVIPDGVSVVVAVGAAGVSVPGAVVVRPFTGAVVRPDAGVVVRPDTGVVSRP